MNQIVGRSFFPFRQSYECCAPVISLKPLGRYRNEHILDKMLNSIEKVSPRPGFATGLRDLRTSAPRSAPLGAKLELPSYLFPRNLRTDTSAICPYEKSLNLFYCKLWIIMLTTREDSPCSIVPLETIDNKRPHF